ncbi:hypothetical protein BDV96DRAFT_605475 [Lophiotrema nucula]|uniref:Uncharacterized protein n=1 Tax=Lophiotrema nucula TaxID=690887 RepID=A0A6A5YP05_9PLEO|nr:hypothetical protein BDV96DRAFT_605475 [Lophiotrema nucula]
MIPLLYYLNTYENRRRMRIASRIFGGITTIFSIVLLVQVSDSKPKPNSKAKSSSFQYWSVIPIVVFFVLFAIVTAAIWWSDMQMYTRVHEYQELRTLEQGRVTEDEAEVFDIGEAEEEVVKDGDDHKEML